MKKMLELEDDLAARLDKVARAAGLPLDRILNDALREGLPKVAQRPSRATPFQQTTHKMGWFPDMTWEKVQEMLLEEEAAEYRCSERGR